MTATAAQLPTRCADLVIKPIGDDGRYVVKNPQSREFFQIEEEEHFLLNQLDGKKDAAAVCTAFEERFGEPLSTDDLDGFLEIARGQGLLEIEGCGLGIGDCNNENASSASIPQPSIRNPQSKQSLLYWRKNIFDPDRLFNWLEPKIRFFWTRGFLVFSALCIVFASGLMWLNRGDVVTMFHSALRWETVVVAWLVMVVVVTLHEFAHGLTCKHYGGEVHEIGFLLMFFMPCFYCNVSDAWLFREKSKRLWVTFAGGYFELFLWALAVFVWRLTALDSLVNYLAFLLVVSAGVQSLFNFNPLLKLDGYYLLSDWVEIPNLRQRALNRSKAHVRRLFWGGPKPDSEKRAGFLTSFGFICWGFSTLFLVVILVSLSNWFSEFMGSAGYALVGVLAVPALLGVLQGTTGGEFSKMITQRRIRTSFWLLLLGGIVSGLCFIKVDEYSSGKFTIRPAQRREVRGPIAGFVKAVYVDEGDRVSPGDVIARLEIPGLDSRIEQKQAELKEAAAQLELLKAGTRQEKIADQKQRIARAERWHAAAENDLARMQRMLAAELNALSAGIAAAEATRDSTKANLARSRKAFEQGATTQSDFDTAEETLKLAIAKLAQEKAGLQARCTKGTLPSEQNLANRAKDLAAERAALMLLQAGVRPQEIAAQQARLERLNAEMQYLQHKQRKLEIRSTVSGIVATPRLREKINHFIHEGDLICVVEDRSHFDAEITLIEEKVESIEIGLDVELMARALSDRLLTGRVTGIAVSAENEDQVQSSIKIRCRLNETPTALRTAMTGHARIYTGRKRPIGKILLDRGLRLLRTEWWW